MTDRTKAPVAGEINEFIIPNATRFSTGNGINVLFIEKNNLPIIYAVAVVKAGSKLDPDKKFGLSYLTSILIDEGAGGLDALQLSDEIEKLGSILNTSSDHDNVLISLMTLKENASKSFEIMGSILSEPRLETADFEREQKKILSRIIQLKNEPSYIAGQAFEHLIYGNSPYGFPEIGFQDSVENISIDDIRKFYIENYGHDNTTVILVGNLSLDEAKDLCTKSFRKIKNKTVIKDVYPLPEKPGKRFFLIDKPESAQSELRIGHISKPRNSDDYFAARVMNTILGGQFSSRINLNLRERHGYTYGASSGFNHYQTTGYFVASTSVKTENTIDAISEILNELKGIRNSISAEEIDFAKSYLLKQFPAKFETYTQIARNFSTIVLHDLPDDYFDNYLKAISELSPEEILQAANEYINPEQSYILAVGDKAKIADSLHKFAGGNLTELDLNGNPVKKD